MASDVNNLSLADVADPHGNGQPTKELMYTDPATGDVISTGCYMSQHGGNLLRFIHGVGSPADKIGLYFEVDSADRVVISEL